MKNKLVCFVLRLVCIIFVRIFIKNRKQRHERSVSRFHSNISSFCLPVCGAETFVYGSISCLLPRCAMDGVAGGDGTWLTVGLFVGGLSDGYSGLVLFTVSMDAFARVASCLVRIFWLRVGIDVRHCGDRCRVVQILGI